MDGEITITCTRCNGTGKFSFNLIHGTVCFGCRGLGVQTTTKRAQNATRARRAAAAQSRALRATIADQVSAELDAKLGPFSQDMKGAYERCVACQKAYGKTPGDIVSERLRSAA